MIIIGEIKRVMACFFFQVNLTKDQTEGLLQKMNNQGFSSNDYNVFQNSCNTFTEVFIL